MAKYTAHHICGHDAELQLYGPGKERERRLRWLATVPCMDCKRAAEQAARAEASVAAAAQAEIAGLPNLTGSEKQVAWAETIRRDRLAQLDKVLDALRQPASRLTEAGRADLFAALDRLAGEYRGQAEARWWIDHRGMSLTTTDLAQAIRARALAPIALAEIDAMRVKREG